jgi:orotate phosphoribosyltransferase
VVASPALGGLIIGHEVARALGARHIFAERDAEGKMTLRRGFEVTADDRVAVVEDVMTTGGSIREVMEVIRANGAQVVAAGALIDRSGGAVSVGVPHHTLATLDATTWQPDRCPLCAAGQEVVKPGSRKS